MQLEGTTFTVSLHGTGYSEDADKAQPPQSKMTVKVRGIGEGNSSATYLATNLQLIYTPWKKPKSPALASIKFNCLEKYVLSREN